MELAFRTLYVEQQLLLLQQHALNITKESMTILGIQSNALRLQLQILGQNDMPLQEHYPTNPSFIGSHPPGLIAAMLYHWHKPLPLPRCG